MFDSWKLRNPAIGLVACRNIILDKCMPPHEKLDNIRFILSKNEKYYPEIQKDVSFQIESNQAYTDSHGLRDGFPQEELLRVIDDYIEPGICANLWNRDILDEFPIDVEKLSLSQLKRIEPMVLLNWHRPDISKPTLHFFQYLTANRSNSPLSLKRITPEEQKDYEYVYSVLCETAEDFFDQYQSVEGNDSSVSQRPFFKEINYILENLSILFLRHELIAKLRQRLDGGDPTDTEYLRTPEGLHMPIEERLTGAFGISRTSMISPITTPVISTETPPKSSSLFQEFRAMNQRVLSRPTVNPRLRSYLAFVGGLDYPLTRELVRTLDEFIRNLQLYYDMSKTIHVIGVDSSRMADRLNSRRGAITYLSSNDGPHIDTNIALVTSDIPCNVTELRENYNLRYVIALGSITQPISGFTIEEVDEVRRHIICAREMNLDESVFSVYVLTRIGSAPLRLGSSHIEYKKIE